MLQYVLQQSFVKSKNLHNIFSRLFVHSLIRGGPLGFANAFASGALRKPIFSFDRFVTSSFETCSRKLLPSVSTVIVRGFKTPLKKPKTKLKTKRAAKKRFIVTGRGKLKRNHSGKVN